MLLLEEAQLQGGRVPSPTVLGCFVLLISCVSSFFPFSVITTSLCNPNAAMSACPLVGRLGTTGQKPHIGEGDASSRDQSAWSFRHKNSAGGSWRPLIQTILDLGAFEAELESIMNDSVDSHRALRHEI